MPNFNVHWVVALESIDAAPTFVKDGATAYAGHAATYARKLLALVSHSTARTASKLRRRLEKATKDWEDGLRKSPRYDDMCCFSAYMLGACGPDFWTLPSPTGVASHHFDLGHYNRTHRQFEVSVRDVVRNDSIQARAEQSYFSGMAAHVGADTVIHQLVNVSAGAYNLLEERWNGERGTLRSAKKWNTHNKVEHYWDTYVRHRYLGDTGPIFGRDAKGWAKEQRFLLVDTLRAAARERAAREAKEADRGKLLEALLGQLAPEEITFAVEKPLMFPWLFCQRVLDGGKAKIAPFIYARVVDKTSGAYPRDVVYADALKEATSAQMGFFRYDEVSKLAFFSSDRNTGSALLGWNYLNYYVCPDLEQVRRSGNDVFYELDALGAFGDAAKGVARRFQGALQGAYASGDPAGLGALCGFWNLDTGLGLEVQRIVSDTPHEVIVRLKFRHVLEDRPAALTFARRDPHVPRGKTALGFQEADGKAFSLYDAPGPFPGIGAVEETAPRLRDRQYLARIALQDRVPPPPPKGETADPEVFFGALLHPPASHAQVPTHSIQEVVRLQVAARHRRLTLQLQASLHDLGAGEQDVVMTLHGDRAAEPNPPFTGNGKTWLGAGTAVLDRTVKASGQVGPLRFFESALLVNLERGTGAVREVEKGRWNNVVPWDEHRASYGRNFAISTGRKKVLRPSEGEGGKGDFDGTRAFDYYENLSPTEHVFFTVFALVKTRDGVHDALSKKACTRAEFLNICRIDALGFVKIVLLFVLGGEGALVLDACYVDGLKVPVKDGAAPQP